MAAKSATLRAVSADEKPEKGAKTVTEAADSGTQRELLVALRSRIARAVADPKTMPRDLASLSRRLIEIAKEIEGIDAEDGSEAGSGREAPDEDWDASAI